VCNRRRHRQKDNGRTSETCYGCDRRSRLQRDLSYAVPGFEGPACSKSAVAVDACRKGQGQPTTARWPTSLAARHVRTIAHAIDSARYDLHGLGSRRITRRRGQGAEARSLRSRTSEPHAACYSKTGIWNIVCRDEDSLALGARDEQRGHSSLLLRAGTAKAEARVELGPGACWCELGTPCQRTAFLEAVLRL